ncbi:hypothetical protein AJ80_07230 [Polytolypa hystricis UAMH7299]|uniref:Yippee domain-containing protein n=1 Tax=Polytolypa hystricis (strain UAMH7299) TaxID=1447883 RepID=A0A2B7XQJ9_POLH7|nr:hypothetical protein AJ80_07230 [Polytolypa hystricis UAMH7299]
MPAAEGHPTLFPSYLLSSIPFRNRHFAHSRTPAPPCSNERRKVLVGDKNSLKCGKCAADLCLASQIISKGFTGRHGRAYLVSASESATNGISRSSPADTSLPNTRTHNSVPRQLVTGAHTVSDISCIFCGSVLGWKYVSADEESQKYKVGKFILETKRISTSPSWEERSRTSDALKSEDETSFPRELEFDSQDEDECEDLFSGIWSPALAARRRRNRNVPSN